MASSTIEIPRNMKALRLVEYNRNYELANVPVPSIEPGELLIRVSASSFCHTDIQVYQGLYKSKCPMIPSHEPAGTIADVGSDVNSQWSVGQRVGVMNFKHPCGKCNKCRWHKGATGKLDARFCERKIMAGITTDGGFAEYIVADAKTTLSLPDDLTFEQAAPLMCAGATVWNAIQLCNLKRGNSIAIIGIGGLGILAVQFAKALGYRTVAIDKRAESLNLAENTGPGLTPDLVCDFKDPTGSQSKIKDFTDGIGLKGVVVCTDDVSAAEWSLKLLQPRGICVPLGLPETGYKFNAFDLVFNELVVKGSLCSSPESAQEMIKTVAKYKVKSHITTVPLEEAESLPEKYIDMNFKGRLVVTMK